MQFNLYIFLKMFLQNLQFLRCIHSLLDFQTHSHSIKNYKTICLTFYTQVFTIFTTKLNKPKLTTSHLSAHQPQSLTYPASTYPTMTHSFPSTHIQPHNYPHHTYPTHTSTYSTYYTYSTIPPYLQHPPPLPSVCVGLKGVGVGCACLKKSS